MATAPHIRLFGEHLLRDGAGVLAAGGALLYAVIALAYDRFYRVLGIAPADVGVTQSAVVTRTAIVLGVVAAIVIAVGAILYTALLVFLPERSSPIARWMMALAVGVGGPLLLAAINMPVLFEGTSTDHTLTVMIALGIAATASLSLRWRLPTNPQLPTLILAVWVAAFGVMYYEVVAGTTDRAGELAARVLDGQPVPPRGLTFMYDVHADPVCVTEIAKPGRSPVSRYGLYLGEASGWVAIYDVNAKRTIRKSRDGLTLRLIPQDLSVPTGQVCG